MAIRTKWDVQPNLALLASQLGVDPSTISAKQNADGSWTVSTPSEAPPSDAVLTAVAQNTAATQTLPQGADIVDPLTPT